MTAAVEFFFDPVCPFCWVTSKWVRTVQGARGLDVEWRLLSLRLINDEAFYATKPQGYPQAHARGLELLRVAAAARDAHGSAALGALYQHMGEAIWEVAADVEDFADVLVHTAKAGNLGQILRRAGLPKELAEAADDDSWDKLILAETRAALERAGGDVGTPILSFSPPDGPAFFGPVISQAPDLDQAVALWDAVETLARFPGFAELKRGLRSFPVTELTAALGGSDTRVS